MPTKKKYREYLSKLDYVPIYFEDWYLNACSPPGKWTYITVEDGDHFGLWPLYIKTKSIFNYITMPHLCKWMGPITNTSDPSIKTRLVRKMMQNFPEHHHFTQNLYYQNIDFGFEDFDISEKYSYQLNLAEDLDTLYANMDSDYRNNKIPKAEKLDLVIGADVEDIIVMQMASYKYGNFDIPFDEKYVRKHVKSIIKQKRGTILSMKDDQNLYASMFLIWDDKKAYYHLAGMNPELRKSGASIRLIWECIKYSKEVLGVQIFDFEGSMIPNLERVRRNFGAQKVHYNNIARTPSKLFGLMSMIKK